MRTLVTSTSPLARLSAVQKLALGSVLAAIGGSIIVVSLALGWTELARPWSFLLGLAGGLTGGVGVPLAICGLVRLGARARSR
jgi:hypothetical protein